MNLSKSRVLVTGSNGFIAKNLLIRLKELNFSTITEFTRKDPIDTLANMIANADAVIHLAGENRPSNDMSYDYGNRQLTQKICNELLNEYKRSGRHIPLIFTSSSQVDKDNLYGKSKLEAERSINALFNITGNPAFIYRLPGVFGKWSKPNYNSVVATFCYNLSRNLPIEINDPDAPLQLVYIDDVVSSIIEVLTSKTTEGVTYPCVKPSYLTTVGKLASHIRSFSDCRTSLICKEVGNGFLRALYSTYLSYLPVKNFAYELPVYTDPRGVFVEMLKTKSNGQISYFTVNPGFTRGGHYHHTKTEKFLVIVGEARFRFRNINNSEYSELFISGEKPQVIDTIPGWTHDITNVGEELMVVMIWANEIFNKEFPDTFSCEI